MDSLYYRYASALLSIATSEDKIKEYKEALIEINQFFDSNLDVKKYLESYMVDLDEKYQVINKISKPYKLDNLSNFLCVLIKNHRFHDFDKFTLEYKKLANSELNILDGTIYSVNKLSEDEIKTVATSLSKKLHKDVELTNKIDLTLIGGVLVMINDHIYDGSVKGKIDQLNLSLKERS